MRNIPIILVVLCLQWSTLDAVEFRVMRPVIVDDSFQELRVEGMAAPGSRSTFDMPPGTVLDSSFYDWQANGCLNKRVWVNDDGSVHATYMRSPDAAFADRDMVYYYSGALGGPFTNFGGIASFRDGFGSLSSYPTTSPLGAVAVISTHNFSTVESFAFIDAFQGIGAFTTLDTNPADQVVWPKPTVNSDGSITLVGTLMNDQTVNGISHNVAWDRAATMSSGFSQNWTWLGQNASDWSEGAIEFPSTASGDSGRVGIVIGDFAADVHYFESTNSGVSFTETLLTNAAVDTVGLPADPSPDATVFLPWINTDIVYAGAEPHVVWTGLQAAQSGGVILYDFGTRILHWSPSTGIDTVVVSRYQGAIPSDTTYVNGGSNHASIDWPQIGTSPDGSVLYVVYVTFNPHDIDPANMIGYGDISGVYSSDGGETWSDPVSISNPGGIYPGADDRYPGISPVNHEASIEPGMDAYLVYQTDNSGGSFIQSEESANMDYFMFTGVDFGDITGVGDEGGGAPIIPTAFALNQNYPNPFNPSTTISFNVPGAAGKAGGAPVSLNVYDIRGRRVKSLIDSALEPGSHRVTWNGNDDSGAKVSSGVYLYTLEIAERACTRKMLILK